MTSKTTHQKLPKLPDSILIPPKHSSQTASRVSDNSTDAKISKRRLTRQPITSKSSGHKEQIIYISSRTPFMSAITRIRKHVSQIQKRRSQSVAATSSKRGSVPLHKAKGDRILAAAIESLDRQDAAAAAKGSAKDEVLVKGTGKAIDKVLSIAGWLQARESSEGVRIRLETGSWWAIDDVEVDEDEEAQDGMEVDGAKHSGQMEEVPDSRTRSISVLTLRVSVL